MDNKDPKKNGGNQPKGPQTLIILLVAGIITMLLFSFVNGLVADSSQKKITYNEFLTMVEEGEVDKVFLDSDKIIIYPKVKEDKSNLFSANMFTYYTGYVGDDQMTEHLMEAGVTIEGEVPDRAGVIESILVSIVPLLLFWLLLSFLINRMAKGSGMMGVGKSNAKVYMEKKTGVTFKDVAGEDEAKESLQEVVDFLHNPLKYTEIGAKLPKGALLVGPPGTGKTLLAKAVAGEANVPFFSISGSDFVEMFVGVGASRVRDLFEDAKKNAPCMIFIDEIDAVARRRGTGMGGGHDEREQTLNQMLVEMDGFGVNEGIIVMAATNRVDILDPAILRPGRFDRKVTVGRPDVKGREEILKVHAKNKPLGDDVNLQNLAQTTAGCSGADLENLLNESAILAASGENSNPSFGE